MFRRHPIRLFALLLLTGHAATAAIIDGTPGDDLLQGTADPDVVSAGAGDDLVFGRGGADLLFGDGGQDQFFWRVTDGSDSVDGGADDDRLELDVGTSDADLTFQEIAGRVVVLYEGFVTETLDVIGVETIVVESGVIGEQSIDASLLPAGVALEVFGGGDPDTLVGSPGDDLLRGEDGDDVIEGGLGNDTIVGDDDDDLILWFAGDGDDLVFGGEGHDVLELHFDDGLGGTVELLGDHPVRVVRDAATPVDLDAYLIQEFHVHGHDGNDHLDARGLDAATRTAHLDGGSGDDVLDGGPGDDVLRGGDDGDVLRGGAGDDVVKGGPGDDVLRWDAGDGLDTLQGDAGHDRLEVRASDADDDNLHASVDGSGLRVDNIGAAPFAVDAESIETLALYGRGGDDRMLVSSLPPGTSAELDGGPGDDDLFAGPVQERLRGGLGADRFYLDVDPSLDTIVDFEPDDAIGVADVLGPIASGTSDPFAEGWLRTVPHGDDTMLQVNLLLGFVDLVHLVGDHHGQLGSDPSDPMMVRRLPEPGAAAGLLSGVLLLAALRRRRPGRLRR